MRDQTSDPWKPALAEAIALLLEEEIAELEASGEKAVPMSAAELDRREAEFLEQVKKMGPPAVVFSDVKHCVEAIARRVVETLAPAELPFLEWYTPQFWRLGAPKDALRASAGAAFAGSASGGGQIITPLVLMLSQTLASMLGADAASAPAAAGSGEIRVVLTEATLARLKEQLARRAAELDGRDGATAGSDESGRLVDPIVEALIASAR